MSEKLSGHVPALAEFQTFDFEPSADSPLLLLFTTSEAPIQDSGNPVFSQRRRGVFSANAEKKQFEPLPETTS